MSRSRYTPYMGSKAWDARTGTQLVQWRKTRRRILARDKGLCQIRSKGCLVQATCVDHILGVGVSELDQDLRAACRPCNASYRAPSNPTVQGRTQW